MSYPIINCIKEIMMSIFNTIISLFKNKREKYEFKKDEVANILNIACANVASKKQSSHVFFNEKESQELHYKFKRAYLRSKGVKEKELNKYFK